MAGSAACVAQMAAATTATATSAPDRDPWATLEMRGNASGRAPSAWTATLNDCAMKSSGPDDVVSSVAATGTAAWNPAWDGTMRELGYGFCGEPCRHQMMI